MLQYCMNNFQVVSVALFFTICSSVAFCSERCKDCDPITGLTVRETIAADRMKDAKRIAEESAQRPWDGMNLKAPQVPSLKPAPFK
jgi:hypothetical protein